jgi:hypothetical protein
LLVIVRHPSGTVEPILFSYMSLLRATGTLILSELPGFGSTASSGCAVETGKNVSPRRAHLQRTVIAMAQGAVRPHHFHSYLFIC